MERWSERDKCSGVYLSLHQIEKINFLQEFTELTVYIAYLLDTSNRHLLMTYRNNFWSVMVTMPGRAALPLLPQSILEESLTFRNKKCMHFKIAIYLSRRQAQHSEVY